MNENTAIKQSNERKQKKTYEKIHTLETEKKTNKQQNKWKKVDWRLTLSA